MYHARPSAGKYEREAPRRTAKVGLVHAFSSICAYENETSVDVELLLRERKFTDEEIGAEFRKIQTTIDNTVDRSDFKEQFQGSM